MPNRPLVPRSSRALAALACLICAVPVAACRGHGETRARQAIETLDAGPVCDPPLDCPPGTEPVRSDTGDLVCGTPPPSCGDAWSCGDPLVCVDGECVDPTCTSSADCAAPLVCVDGACEQPSCDACPLGFHCVTSGLGGALDHACVPDSCTADTDCPAALHCLGGACTDATPCTTTDDCVLGTCVGGLCHLGCQTALDCGTGQVCDPTLAMCRPPCASDAACGTGYVCSAGLCQPSPCGTCMPDQVCVSGQCIACNSIGGDGSGGGCGSGGVGSDAGVIVIGVDAGSGSGSDGIPDAGSGSGGIPDAGSGSGTRVVTIPL